MANDLKSNMIQGKLSLADPWYRLIVKMLEPVILDLGGQHFIEVGCGLGGFVINVAKQGWKIVGMDVSANAIRTARNLAKQLKLQGQVDLVVGDAQCLPFKEEASGTVICSETLEHVEDYRKAFGELLRITGKSGYLCLTVPNFLSTALFENVILLVVGQPAYVRSKVCVEKEHIFHFFKLKRLLSRSDIRIITIQSVDFLHIPPRVRRLLRIDKSLSLVSQKLEVFFGKYFPPLRLLGANIGVLARKE